MSKDVINGVVKEFRDQVTPLVESALNTGTNHFSQEIRKVVQVNSQSPKEFLIETSATLKKGAIEAGRELLTKGIEQLEKKK
ncbi:hypothetical protein MUN88_06360 [Gracilibacillus caseinilyticus]|uniref:Uncharacterized protein n=1 Tax=Gracilibacillus caseinilyticus TaxID=2932256 RepID=A0ABY4F0S1_9BACI|nr:hypothetical protein [Gracilibacillus caseinilyticus]UOQ49698.1 hypothetical protein MUN88_06360 [Gracilibacillus caseinilyticus]